MNQSVNGIVVLRDMHLNSSGTYKCEVSADKTFQTIFKKKQLRVYGIIYINDLKSYI